MLLHVDLLVNVVGFFERTCNFFLVSGFEALL